EPLHQQGVLGRGELPQPPQLLFGLAHSVAFRACRAKVRSAATAVSAGTPYSPAAPVHSRCSRPPRTWLTTSSGPGRGASGAAGSWSGESASRSGPSPGSSVSRSPRWVSRTEEATGGAATGMADGPRECPGTASAVVSGRGVRANQPDPSASSPE